MSFHMLQDEGLAADSMRAPLENFREALLSVYEFDEDTIVTLHGDMPKLGGADAQGTSLKAAEAYWRAAI